MYGGGIVGYSEGGNIQDCVNKATVNSPIVGGIVGYVNSSSSVSILGCVNLGKITGSNYGAGIVGSYNGSISISLCINTGSISSSGTACGISGGTSSNCVVQQCVNLGTLSASNFLYGITSGSGTINDNISAGKFDGSVTDTMYAVSSSEGTNYYDASIGSGVTSSNATSKTTTELFSVFDDPVSWSSDENRYPLPNLQSRLPEGIWDEIVVAATPEDIGGGTGGGATALQGTPVTSEEELISAIENTSVDTIIIASGFTITESITIDRDITIAANSDVTVTDDSKYSDDEYDYAFWVKDGGKLTLGGGSGVLTFKQATGKNYETIGTVTSKATIEININNNVKFTENKYCCIILCADTGAVLNINGGEFVNNSYTPICINNQNAVCKITGGTIANNSSSSNNCAGICVKKGQLTILGGNITDNTYNNSSSGSSIKVPSSSSGFVIVNGETLTENTTYTKNIIDGIPQ